MIDLLLDRAAELQDDHFDHTQPRVSRISECIRSHVATMLGMFRKPFPAYYRVAGHSLQNAYAKELERVGCVVHQEVGVLTSVEGVECHIDMLVHDGPTMYCVEAKTTTDTMVEILQESGHPKKAAAEQALLQWAFLQDRHHVTGGATRLPDVFGVLVLGRESFGFKRAWFPLRFDAVRARVLKAKFLSLVEYRDRGELPPRPYARPNTDCQWRDWTCPLYNSCWS